ncbi:MAG: hypothetical protein U0835_00380 [Isosphaeraceae bacterium]
MTLFAMPKIGDELLYMPKLLSDTNRELENAPTERLVVVAFDENWMCMKTMSGEDRFIQKPTIQDIREGKYYTLSHLDEMGYPVADNLGENPPFFRRKITPAGSVLARHGRVCEVCKTHTYDLACLEIERLVVEDFPGGLRFYIPHETWLGHPKCLESIPIQKAG